MDDQPPVEDDVEDDGYGYCNSCGEEMWLGEECCDDGEWTHVDA